MVTKKEFKSKSKEARHVFKLLQQCMERKDYKGKTERDINVHDQHPLYKYYKLIILKLDKFEYEYPLTKKQYEDYKILEKEFWTQ